MVHDSHIEVLSSKMGISMGGYHLEYTILNSKDRDIEGSSSQIKHQDILLTSLLIKSIGNGSSSGLIENTDNIESRNGSCILSGLSLGIIEICGDSHHSIGHCLTKVSLGDLLHLNQDHGRDLLWWHGLVLILNSGLYVWLALVVDYLEG